jgi:hypothetical protein
MSVQFRTSQKDLISKINSAVSKELGVCCKYDFSRGFVATFSTPLDCYLSGGNFQYGDLSTVNCADISSSTGLGGISVLGCCCACSIAKESNNYKSYIAGMMPVDQYCSTTTVPPAALNNFGLKNITSCECERIGGKWTAGVCPDPDPTIPLADAATVRTYCYKSLVLDVPPPSPSDPTQNLGQLLPPCEIDVRLPRSCCYFDYDINGFPVGLSCENVCNPRECELKSISTHPSSYSTGTVCPPSILSTTVTTSPYQCGNLASIIASGSHLFQAIPYGSCYRLIDNGINGYSYDCEVTAEFFCHDGYWVTIDNETQLCNNNPNKPQIPIKSARKVEPESMTEDDFTSLDLEIGQLYKGGYYIGIFDSGAPLSPNGSDLYGSKQFGYSSTFKSDASGYGDKYTKSALFVEPLSFNTSLFSSNEPDNTDYYLLSTYDGFYNCYGNAFSFSGIKSKTTNTIVGKNRKGFIDYYIPSINELMFLAKQQITNIDLANILELSGTYMSSSSYSDFIYTQYFSENPVYTGIYDIGNYGRILLAKPTSLLSCRFFRKIVLT